MKAQLKSSLVISLLVFAGFVMVWNFGTEDVNVQGAVLYVGNDSTYKTIQAGVDNATAGDTIYVKNGTYYESVLANKSNIKLIGNSTTDCKIIHHYMGTNYLTDFAAGINVTASNVNITGFNISVSGNFTFGICLTSGVVNSSIINNNITTSDYRGYGIFMHQTTDNDITGNTINITGDQGYGIWLMDSSNNNVLYDNAINSTGQYGIGIYGTGSSFNTIANNEIDTFNIGGKGVYLRGIAYNNTVANNTINIFNSYSFQSSGIYLWLYLYNHLLINNTININNTNGYGIHLRGANKNDVTNNTINTSGEDGYGIFIDQSSNNITGNTINTSGQGGYGILLDGSSNNNLTDNYINTTGQDGLGIILMFSSIKNNVTWNTITTFNSSSYGIHLTQNSDDNNVNNNTIDTFGQNAIGISLTTGSDYNDLNDNTINLYNAGKYGFNLATSQNNDLINNTINIMNGWGKGIRLYQLSNNNDIIDNTIITTQQDTPGIYLQTNPSKNNIINNTINTSGQDSYGIYLDQAPENNIFDNSINTSGALGYGIYIEAESNDTKLINNTIVTFGVDACGINITNSNNTIIESCNITTAQSDAFGIYLDGNFAYAFNTTISSAALDFNITNNGNLSALNCNFTDVDVESDGGGVLQVKNFLTIQAYYDDAVTPIPAADILVEDNGLSVYNTSGYGGTDPQSDVNGRVANIISDDRWYYYNNVAYEINNSIKVKKTDAASWEETRSVDMNTSHTETFISVDITAPSIPTGLKVVQETPGVYDLNISWDPNTDDTVNYSVYKFNFSVFQWQLLVNLTHPTNWTLDTNLLDGMWHLYRVEAWDGNGYPSGVSNSVSVYFPDLTPPGTPTGLTVTPVPGGDALNITWDANTDDTVKYEFWYFNPHAQNWFRIANLSQPKTWFLFEYGDLINGTKYFFRLRAYDNTDLNSSFAVANGTHRDYLAPVAPTNLTAETRSETSIYLSWNRSTDLDVEGYRIYVNQSGAGMGGPYRVNNAVDGSTYSYEVTDLLENETYYFVALAFDEANNPSLYSNEAKNTTANVAPLKPILDSLPALTNNTKLNVTGTALNSTGTPEYKATVQVFNNDQFASDGLVNSTGRFSIEITIDEGENSITAKVIDRADNPSGLTEPVKVILDTQEPIVELDEFVEYTNSQDFYVTGTTENNSEVFVYNNDVLATIGYANSEGKFNLNITLIEGKNSLTANALDPAENNGSISAARVVILDLENPVASAGADISIYIGDNATLNGSGSTDNWVIANYTWSFDYGSNNIELYGEIVQFQFKLEDVYKVTLTVTDGAGNSEDDTLWVVVAQLDELDTEPPVARSGANQTVVEGSEVTFNGSASTDNDAISNYTWKFTYDGDSVTLYGMNPTFVFDISGDYTITLTVSDNATPANTDTDTLWVKVIKLSEYDSDGDGMDDFWEDNYNLSKYDPSDANENYDGDNLTNIEEYENGTNPRDSDSDGDQLPDDWELANNLDPTDEGSVNEINGASGDPDGDDYTNLEEFRAETDPQDSASHPKEAEDDEDDEDYLQYIIIMIIAIIILIIILGLALRKPVSEEELLAAEEEEELPGEEPGMESGVDEGESAPPKGEGDFECPTCGAILTDADTVCPECGEEFEDDEEQY